MKELEVKCFFGVNRDNSDNHSVFEINDPLSGKRILSLEFDPVQFTQLMGRMGAVRGKAILIDDKDYVNIGKRRVLDEVVVSVDRFNFDSPDYSLVLKKAADILKERNDGYDWNLSDYFGSKGSTWLEGNQRFFKVKAIRYE